VLHGQAEDGRPGSHPGRAVRERGRGGSSAGYRGPRPLPGAARRLAPWR
jgi:hypothetical protein